jgi:signal peptidase II
VTGRRRLASTLLVAVVVVALDQVTKSIAVAHLHQPVHLFGPFGLRLTFNSGAAFSLFTGATAVIVVVAVAVIALLGWIAWRTTTGGLSVALGLIMGGALGNLSDRLLRAHHGSVVDFVTLTHWPTFNVADAGITIGAILVVVLSLFGPRPAESP